MESHEEWGEGNFSDWHYIPRPPGNYISGSRWRWQARKVWLLNLIGVGFPAKMDTEHYFVVPIQ